MPKVSVIMPIFNSERFLREAIESILTQTLRDFELIIVSEHNGDDDSDNIVLEYMKQDDRIVFLKNEKKKEFHSQSIMG
nr:glycosyltransferase [Paenibacillus ginsengarvi]